MSGKANQDSAYVLAAGLARAGVRHAVVSPGSRNTPLVLGLSACDEITTHVVLDERDAGFVGLGLARALGEPVVLSCTSGSATANYLPAVMEAYHSRIPLLVLTADRPLELHGCGAPQTVDQGELYGKFTRWSVDLGTPSGMDGHPVPGHMDHVARCAAQAVERAWGASSEASGPVHINCPFREPLWDLGWTPPSLSKFEPSAPQRTQADASWLPQLADRIRTARRGLIYCGALEAGGRDPEELASAVGALAQRLGWPILAEPTSQLRFGAQEVSHVVSTYDAMLQHPEFSREHAPDLIVRVGRAPLAKHVRRWMKEHAEHRVVSLEPAGERLDPDGVVDTIVAGDLVTNLRALFESVPPNDDNAWLRSWLHSDAAATGVIANACDGTWWEGAIARNVVYALPSNSVLHVAASMPVRDLDSFTSAQARPLTIHCNRGTNGIDGLIATAIGEALAKPAQPTVLLVGDLAFLHNAGALGTARALGARLTVVVVDNGGGGIFDHLPIAQHSDAFERFFVTPQPVDVASVAAGYGWRVRRAGYAGELRTILEESLVSDEGPTVIHAVVDRTQSNDQRRRTIAGVHRALTARRLRAGEEAA